jgi:ABC-type nitrate/sulfonate/bicarbonate transport system substrate-binding protein
MEIQEALAIVRKLANGVHPETGEVVTSDSLYQHPQVVRALHRALVALEFQQERERTRKFLPANAGKSWSDQEDAQISEELRHGINFEGMAKAHNRTVGSIIARLVRLGKISAGPPPGKSS